jgi:hypothetical protein
MKIILSTLLALVTSVAWAGTNIPVNVDNSTGNVVSPLGNPINFPTGKFTINGLAPGSAAFTSSGAYDAAGSASTAQSNATTAAAASAATLYVPLTATRGVPNGGTGLSTVPTGDLLLGNGTSALTLLAPGANVVTDLANAANGLNGIPTDVGGTTTVYYNLTVPGTLTLTGGIVGTLYSHSFLSTAAPTLGASGKWEIGYATDTGIPYIGQGAGNVNLVNTAGIGVPPTASFTGAYGSTGTDEAIYSQPSSISGSAGDDSSFNGPAFIVATGSLTDVNTGFNNNPAGGNLVVKAGSLDYSGATGSSYGNGGNVYVFGGEVKAASGNTALGGNLFNDGGYAFNGSSNTAGTANLGTLSGSTAVTVKGVTYHPSTSAVVIGHGTIPVTLTGQPLGTALLGVMTPNTTGTITFNTNGQNQTIYNTSATTISSATITLPTGVATNPSGQTLTYVGHGTLTSVTMAGGTVDAGSAPTTYVADSAALVWRADTVPGHFVRIQ